MIKKKTGKQTGEIVMNMIGNQMSGAIGAFLSTKNTNDPDARMSYIRRTSVRNTKKKQLNYNHKEISTQILRASKARTASGVLARAKSKLSTLKRCQGTGQYDESELRYAIAHARRMVQCAAKKMQNLKEEEMLQSRLEREQTAGELQRKAEVKQRAARKEQQLEQKIVIKEAEQNRRAKKEWQEFIRKQNSNRNKERGKIMEADMKYLKGKIDSMRDQGYSADSSEILSLQASLEEISREQMMLAAGQEADVSVEGVSADAAGTVPAAMAATGLGTIAGAGSSVDIML